MENKAFHDGLIHLKSNSSIQDLFCSFSETNQCIYLNAPVEDVASSSIDIFFCAFNSRIVFSQRRLNYCLPFSMNTKQLKIFFLILLVVEVPHFVTN